MVELRLELGSFRAVGAELGISARTAAAWARGAAAGWSEAKAELWAQRLYERALVRQGRRLPEVDAALRRRRAEPVYSELAQKRAGKRLAIELRKLERRRRLAHGRWSPLRELARSLDVSVVRVGRWLAGKRVPQAFMAEFDRWQQDQQDEQERELRERGQVDALLDECKLPGKAPALAGAKKRRPARRTPVFENDQGRVDGESYSGFVWNLRVEAWFSYEGLNRWCEWALSRERPDRAHLRTARHWIVTALVSVLLRPGVKGPKSPGGYRHFGTRSKRALGARLQIGAPVSSGRVEKGGLPAAVELFRANFDDEASAGHRIYVHGVLVRNWRLRSQDERQAYRERIQARLDSEQREREREQERRKAKAQEKARARAQQRARARTKGRRT